MTIQTQQLYHNRLSKLEDIPNFEQIQQLAPNSKAYLFDMDGTLIDSESLHALATIEMMGERAKKVDPKDFPALKQELLGKADPEVMSILQQRELLPQDQDIAELVAQKNKNLFDRVKQMNDYDSYLFPRMIELLKAIKASKTPMVVVTASEGDLARALLAHFEIDHFFEFIITRESAKTTKPTAAPYNMACEMLALNASDVLVFEDSPTGMQAAQAAQMKFIQADWYPGLSQLRYP